MAVVAGHDRADDRAAVEGDQEQLGLHRQLGGDGNRGAVPIRRVGEGLAPESVDAVEHPRVVRRNLRRHQASSGNRIFRALAQSLAICAFSESRPSNFSSPRMKAIRLVSRVWP